MNKVHEGADKTQPWKDYVSPALNDANVSRFTKLHHNFDGYRLMIIRGGCSFLRYFPDYAYGGKTEAYRAVSWCRDIILKKMNEISKSCAGESKSMIRMALGKFLVRILDIPTVEFGNVEKIDPGQFRSKSHECTEQ